MQMQLSTMTKNKAEVYDFFMLQKKDQDEEALRRKLSIMKKNATRCISLPAFTYSTSCIQKHTEAYMACDV